MSLLRQLRSFGSIGGTPMVSRFVLAWALAPAVHMGLRLGGLQRTIDLIESLPRVAVTDDDEIEAVSRAVAAAFRLHWALRGLCLERALVAYGIHRLRGSQARLIIGVRRAGGQIEAHAWVEGREQAGAREGYQEILVCEAA